MPGKKRRGDSASSSHRYSSDPYGDLHEEAMREVDEILKELAEIQKILEETLRSMRISI